MKKGQELKLIFDEGTIPIIHQMTEGMPGGFFIYHADGDEELIYINSAVLRIFGCETEEEFRELTGFTFKGMVYHEDLEEIENSISQQITNSVYDLDYVEYRIVQKDGSLRWIEDYGHFMHTEAYGDIFYVFIEDATERLKKRMTELEKINDELRNTYARESQYRKAILYDADIFLEINLTKNEFICASVQEANGQVHDLFGYMGIQPFEKYSDYIDFLKNNIDICGEESFGTFFNRERLIQCHDNGELEQTHDSWVIDALGRKRLCHFIFLLGKNEYTDDIITLSIAKDVTEQMERQNLLKSALQQAQNANIARNTFLFNMSHDIRTPLNAIIGYTELARSHKTEPDKIDYYMNKIHISGEQLLAIVNEALEITHMESGKAKLIESEFLLGDLLGEVEKKFRRQADVKSIQFIIDKSKVKHSVIIADYMRMHEILSQLLDNGIKYTEQKGKISLSVIEKDMNLKNYSSYQFIVEDNGRGISEDFKADLFNPFMRENNTTKSGVLGTGLGLAVVKNLVDMMEGSIELESQVGHGSKFTVNLMLKLGEKQLQEEQEASLHVLSEEDLKGKRILLVEDNEINSEIAKELLISQGYIVDTANDGSVAFKIISNSTPGYYSLILMDIQMPVMDGHEATRAIRGLPNKELANIPIIALSANAFAEDYEKSFESGMNAHFPKPINMAELQEMIKDVLCRSL
ncbi:MAG: response regulator [Lachnospiraceae bacterium]